MAQDDRGGSLPILPLVALLLFTGGLLVQHEPLQSDRPVVQTRIITVPHYGQDVEARLWQDPLEAVQSADRAPDNSAEAKRADHANAICGNPSAKCHRPDWLKATIAQNKNKRTLILPVMIFGGPYAEDAEDRRRSRHAVLSNLIDSGYQPVYSRGIGYVRFADAAADINEFPRLIPFERFDRDENNAAGKTPGYAHVVVLWLTEESFVPGATDRLEKLFVRLLPTKGDAANVDVKVIGPASPETAAQLQPLFLRTGRHDHECRDHEKSSAWLGRCVDFLAPRLTAATNVDNQNTALRFSPDDRQIVKTLIGELRNRQLVLPDPDSGRGPSCLDSSGLDHIAVVVEADTHYGRSLERELRSALGCPPSGNRTMLHAFRYFRGLDGKISHTEGDANKSAGPAGSQSAKETTAPQERSQGQSQFDYLLRIAAWAREQNDRLGSKAREEGSIFDIHPTGRSIRAVVILGSDVYDKLAILHALRERLPQAIFATSDLDAGFLQADQLRWTRNLVVTSGYDIRLHRSDSIPRHSSDGDVNARVMDNPQKSAPPFRDTYQTATFLAMSRAISDANDQSIECLRNAALKNPKLFEIGDGTAVELSSAHPVAIKDCMPNNSVATFGAWTVARVALGFIVLLAFSLVFSWCLRGAVIEHWPVLVATAVLIVAYACGSVWVSGLPGEEPLRWLDGVSIWPTEFVRLAVFIFGIGLFLHARRRLREGEAHIESKFFPPDPQIPFDDILALKTGKALKSIWVDFWRCIAKGPGDFRRRIWPLLPGTSGETLVHVKALWEDYLKWTSPATVVLRICIGVLFYFSFSMVVISLDPPIVPARGSISFIVDSWTTKAAVLAILVVLVATLGRVAVSTLLLRRLYGGAAAKPSDWDAATLARFGVLRCDASKSYVDLMLSASITESVGEIVLYPFALSVLLVIARSQLFDNWVTPRGLLAVITLGLLLVIAGALALRHSAERIRSHTLQQLTEVEVSRRNGHGGSDNVSCNPDAVRLMREVTTNLRTGAFAPLSEQPIVRAILLPFGGAGAMSLLEYVLMAKT